MDETAFVAAGACWDYECLPLSIQDTRPWACHSSLGLWFVRREARIDVCILQTLTMITSCSTHDIRDPFFTLDSRKSIDGTVQYNTAY